MSDIRFTGNQWIARHPGRNPWEDEEAWEDEDVRTAAIIGIAVLGASMLCLLIWLLIGGHEE